MRRHISHSIRHQVAREAAALLYTQQEKEYKQAKLRATETLRARSLPSNKDIALELDKMAEEMEGSGRAQRLTQMRKDALWIMVILGNFHPRLVGSVWRGTAHKNSDIDVEAFTTDTSTILERLTRNGLVVRTAQWQLVSKGPETERALHIYLTLPSKNEVELIVRSPEKKDETGECEIYGDTIKGLNIHQLRRVILTDPSQKFVPT